MDGEACRNMDRIKQQCDSALEGLGPDTIGQTVENLSLIDVRTVAELEVVVWTIFDRALLQPHFADTYAECICVLSSRYPEFPNPEVLHKPVTFLRTLFNLCQDIFEHLTRAIEEPTMPAHAEPVLHRLEESNQEADRRDANTLALLRLIAELFKHRLLNSKVMGQIVFDLIGMTGSTKTIELPTEASVESCCIFIQIIGPTLAESLQGRTLLQSFLARLKQLKHMRKVANDRSSWAYSKHCQWAIQDLVELQKHNWIQEPVMIVQLVLEGEDRDTIHCMSLTGATLGIIKGVGNVAGLSSVLADRMKHLVPRKSFRALLPDGSFLREQDGAIAIAQLFNQNVETEPQSVGNCSVVREGTF